MQIRFNSEWMDINEKSLADFLKNRDLFFRTGIAIAINQVVIPKNEWEETTLQNMDEIIIITAAAGG